MRLLMRNSDGEFDLTDDLVDDIPAYAILSHTWGDDDQEVTYKDLVEGLGKSKAGYQKIQFCGEQATRDGLRYFWVDTCCIDKTVWAEVQMSINSMFRWYKNAARCYVYLSDIFMSDYMVGDNSGLDLESGIGTAKWFTRGWTLQELLAPSSVIFFSADCKRLGDKLTLERLIHKRTRISVEALRHYDATKFSFDECVSWVAKRKTKREEDMAYSLLGLFGIFLPLIYGEGRKNAFRRLREEVNKSVYSYEFHELPESSYENRPNLSEAEDIDHKTFELSKEVLSKTHPPTLKTMNSTPPLDLYSEITSSYRYRSFPLKWAAGRNMIPFNPYALRRQNPREQSILTWEMIEPLQTMANQMSQCGFFDKPDCTRFEEAWNREEELECRKFPASTINDLVLPVIKAMNCRNQKSAIWMFIFNCLLEAYRLQIDDRNFSIFEDSLHQYDKHTMETYMCLFRLCSLLGKAWDGWHLSLVACLVNKFGISKLKEFFRATHRPVAFHLLRQELDQLHPPYVEDKRTALEYVQDCLGVCYANRQAIAVALSWSMDQWFSGNVIDLSQCSLRMGFNTNNGPRGIAKLTQVNPGTREGLSQNPY